MSRQNAKELIIKIETAEASDTFITLGMLTTTDFSTASNMVDETSKDSTDSKREGSAGVLSMSASGTMYFDSGAAQERLRAAQAARETPKLQIIDPGAGTYEGRYVITSLGKSGGFEGSVESNFQIENANAWTFTAE